MHIFSRLSSFIQKSRCDNNHESYLAEFMWRKNTGKKNVLNELLKAVYEIQPKMYSVISNLQNIFMKYVLYYCCYHLLLFICTRLHTMSLATLANS